MSRKSMCKGTEKKFWSPDRLEKTGKPLLISIGSRGIGKSTGIALRCIKRYYGKGEKFLYCRRTEDELKRTAKSYFSGACLIEGSGHTWTYSQGEYKDEKGDIVGWSVPLSLADKYKSATFGSEGVRTIIYDECAVRRGQESRYLGKAGSTLEYDLLIGLYQTVDRAPGHSFLNQTKIFCLGNYSNYLCPVLLGIHADRYITTDTRFCSPKTQPWAFELTDQVSATIDIKRSYGYLLSSEAQAASDYDSKDIKVEDDIGKKHGVFIPLVSVQYHERKYTIYEMPKEGVLYVSSRISPQISQVIALTASDGGINRVTATRYQGSFAMSYIRQAAEKGFLWYESRQAKSDMLTYLRFTV